MKCEGERQKGIAFVETSGLTQYPIPDGQASIICSRTEETDATGREIRYVEWQGEPGALLPVSRVWVAELFDLKRFPDEIRSLPWPLELVAEAGYNEGMDTPVFSLPPVHPSDQDMIGFFNSLPTMDEVARPLMLPAELLTFAPRDDRTYLNYEAARGMGRHNRFQDGGVEGHAGTSG